MGDLAAAATTYARAGWPVFPLAPGGKAPAISKRAGGNGFEDATTNLDQIARWWSQYPNANIGMPTGIKADVLDVDVRLAGHGWGHFGDLSAAGLLVGAFAIATTRNDGAHFYYAPSGIRCRSFKGKWLDVKARGGYVVLPPSKVAADPGIDGPGFYQWAEFDLEVERKTLNVDAIDRFLNPPRATTDPTSTPNTPGSGSFWDQFGGSGGSGGVDSLAKWLKRETEGNRNKSLFWAANRALDAGQLDPESRRKLADAAQAAGLSPAAVEATLKSAEKRTAK